MKINSTVVTYVPYVQNEMVEYLNFFFFETLQIYIHIYVENKLFWNDIDTHHHASSQSLKEFGSCSFLFVNVDKLKLLSFTFAKTLCTWLLYLAINYII